jgi:predicted small lipoprotein YifL
MPNLLRTCSRTVVSFCSVAGRNLPWRGGAAPARPRRAALAVLAVLAAAAAAAGCGRQHPVALPPPAGPASAASAPAASPPTARDQVISAYISYWQASGQAIDAGRPGRARAILAPYVTADSLPSMIAVLQQDWQQHAAAYGSPVLHIRSVVIRHGTATVHDCIDLSHAGLRNARTGRVFPRSFGSPRANYYASLVRDGGRWLVSNVVPVVASCDP